MYSVYVAKRIFLEKKNVSQLVFMTFLETIRKKVRKKKEFLKSFLQLCIVGKPFFEGPKIVMIILTVKVYCRPYC